MDLVFLDANILFSAAYRKENGLLRLWELDIKLITSAYALEEAKINLEEDEQLLQLNKLVDAIKIITKIPSYDTEVIRASAVKHPELPKGINLPDKDIPILATAIYARAAHLLTGDFRHFGKYYGQDIKGVLILSPAAYMNMQH